MGVGGAMLESLDNRSSLRPAVEEQVLRTVRQCVLDTGFKVLPFSIAEMVEAVRAGRGAYIIAIRYSKERQAKTGQRLKDTQRFFSCHSTAMHQQCPGCELARHEPSWHCP